MIYCNKSLGILAAQDSIPANGLLSLPGYQRIYICIMYCGMFQPFNREGSWQFGNCCRRNIVIDIYKLCVSGVRWCHSGVVIMM